MAKCLRICQIEHILRDFCGKTDWLQKCKGLRRTLIQIRAGPKNDASNRAAFAGLATRSQGTRLRKGAPLIISKHGEVWQPNCS